MAETIGADIASREQHEIDSTLQLELPFLVGEPVTILYVQMDGTGAIENAQQFGKRLYFQAWKRGWSGAEKKVVIGDGAQRIWNLAKQHFPGAIQIVDLFHHAST